ncbi:MAG: Coenzyme F420 hydrogenase/dehydrogenase, beta subunit C-terminal domain [bacterium]
MRQFSTARLVNPLSENLTIEKVVKNDLCTRCGVCDPICPHDSIKFDGNFYPWVDWSTCTNCGLCELICPGLEFDFKKQYQKMFAVDHPIHMPEGYFKKAYIGYSNHNKIKEKGSSGGLVTQILVYLLGEKMVDAVVLVSDNEHDPTAPIPKIARTEEEIIAGAGSKYSVVPITKILNEVRRTREKIAFVGVACQIHGLRRLEELNKRLSRNVKLVIGLACNATLENDVIKDLLWRKGLTKSQVKQITYRNGTFPGKLTATLKDGNKVQLMKHGMCESYGRLRLLYEPPRCHLCSDYTAEFADISVADIMLRGSNGEYLFSDGRSVALCRTEAGLKVMEDMEKAGVINVSPLSSDLVQKNFRKMILVKKILPYQMIRKLKNKKKLHPIYNTNGLPPTLRHILYEMVRTPIYRFYSFPVVRKIGVALLFSKYGEHLTNLKFIWKKLKAKRYKEPC